MTCRDCNDENESSRHTPIVDQPTVEPAPGFTPESISPQPGGSEDPFAAFFAARNMSYKDLTSRKEFRQQLMEQQSEQVMGQMTDAMRQLHVDELIGVANCEKMAVPGMTPGQAIVALKETLLRPEFHFIESMYPGLNVAVDKRFVRIQEERLPTRKKE